MPKFVGSKIEGARAIGNNATHVPGYVRVTYSQAVLLPVSAVICSLDTTDKGGPRSFAKRWYRWFALASEIATNPASTPNMRARAELPIYLLAHNARATQAGQVLADYLVEHAASSEAT